MNPKPSPDIPVCVITGGTSGIGLATAKQFAKHGYQLAICARRESQLETAKEQILEVSNTETIPFAMQADLNDPSQATDFIAEVQAKFGRIDVLVNNAGVAPLGPFESIDQASFDQVLNVNIRSVFQLTQSAWKQMLKQGRGVVVNISSLAAIDPFPGFSLYGASKAWIELLTVALAAEGAESGIRVCSIRPGAVETPLLRGLFPDFPADQCASPEDVAEKIWGCVDDPNAFPSGHAFEVTNQK